jgi:hypothetical protein
MPWRDVVRAGSPDLTHFKVAMFKMNLLQILKLNNTKV